jgi:hypothetical protein
MYPENIQNQRNVPEKHVDQRNVPENTESAEEF